MQEVQKKLPGTELENVSGVAKSYKVHHRPQIHSSGFLGVNLGLDLVRNLSKRGFKPNEDDQNA